MYHKCRENSSHLRQLLLSVLTLVKNHGKSISSNLTISSVLLTAKNPDVCSAHYIREKVIDQLVLESMQRVLWYVQSYEKLFAQRQLAEFGEKQKKELTEKRRELDKAKQRVREIDGFIQKLYEDNAMGKISDERFATMSMSLENAKVKTEGLQRFIDKAKQVTRLEALTPEVVHEFIEKIVVYAPEYKAGF